MAHVMPATHQDHKMKQVMTKMDCTTAYVINDVKQKFLVCEGGDPYYGKRACSGGACEAMCCIK